MKIKLFFRQLTSKLGGYFNARVRSIRRHLAAVQTRIKQFQPAVISRIKTGFQWIGKHREGFLYYSVLAVVLAALGTAAYGYRNGGLKQSASVELLNSPEPAAIAQSFPEPSATTEPENIAPLPPVDGDVLRSFAADELVWSDTLGMWQTHPAVDFSADTGEAVVAAADAVVLDAYVDPLYGCVIVLDLGDGCTMRYASLNTLQLVEIGQTVARGEIISAAGTCEGEMELSAHVHVEYYENGRAVDPASLMFEN